MVDRLPNFFIVGAPKCGTTSLAGWLAQHPNILMSSAKEPHYYNTDFGNRHTHSPAEYSRFFKHPPAVCDAVGEASVWYLYSHAAVPNILVDVPAAKFIVMLRNPVEMAPSLHEQQLVNGTEDVADFAAAWRLQTEREAGRSIPRLCEEPKLLLYGPACRLGEQLQRLYRVAGQEQVLPLLLDDVKQDPRAAYATVLQFLAVRDDGRVEFPVANPAKRRRFPLLRRGMIAVARLRESLRVPTLGLGIYRWVDQRNLEYRPRAPVADQLRKELVDYYREDVALLASILERDLSQWCAT